MNIHLKEIKLNLNPCEVYEAFRYEIDTIILDSSKEDEKLSKYSFIGLNPYMTFSSFQNDGYIDGVKVEGNPFKILDELLTRNKVVEKTNIPLIGGCMGYISYDTGRIIEKISDSSDEDFKIPHMKFVFYRNIIIFDLMENKQYISYFAGEEKTVEVIIEKIEQIEVKKEEFSYNQEEKFISNFTKEEYKKSITRLKGYIRSGDVYIANMTQRFYCHNEEDSFTIYKKLREINKAPFSAYLNFHDFQIISSSPERFIQIKDRIAHTRPIKGTRPRGNTIDEDEKNKLELINSEKDKSELLMIVDLERNDFSKVCKPCTVKVKELFALEEYATVFHLVSTIEGELQDDVSAVKVMKECFPGGSITGAPKIRAMEIIEELEGLKRNIYTGAIGYFDFRGNSDFNIAIRTILKRDNKAYFGVGGGITYESIEEDEYLETLDKAKALMKVL